MPQNNSHAKNPPTPKRSFPVIFGNLGKDVTLKTVVIFWQ